VRKAVGAEFCPLRLSTYIHRLDDRIDERLDLDVELGVGTKVGRKATGNRSGAVGTDGLESRVHAGEIWKATVIQGTPIRPRPRFTKQ
jgi:hypothetical protein